MKVRKQTYRSTRRNNTLIQIAKEFKSFKKLARSEFNTKYRNPYLFQYVKQNTSNTIIPKYKIPTEFQLHTISGFVNNKHSHYNTFFKDQQIFISDIEYLFKYHTLLETSIKLYASYKHITIIPNFYPQGNYIMSIVNNYHTDISKFPFQGRKAYFRYTFRPATIINHTPIVIEPENEEKQSISSFASKKSKSKSNSNPFLYLNKSKEEDLNMTINNDNSNFFNESLLNKINARSEHSDDSISHNPNTKKQKKSRDIRAHHISFESIEHLIENITQIEEDKKKILPTRKQNLPNGKNKLHLKQNLLLTSIRNELKQLNIRNNTSNNDRYKFKTRKEKFNIHFFNKLNQYTNKQYLTENSKSSKNDFSINSFYKHAEHFVYGKVSSEYKYERKRNMVTSVLLEYNKNRIAKEKEMKKEQFFKTQKQITKPKVMSLQTERRIQRDWMRYKEGKECGKEMNSNRTISHKYCDTLDSEIFYCKTHNSIINPNNDKEMYKIENKTKKLMFKLRKRNERFKETVDKSYKTVPGKRISMMSMACRPDIYENYGMRKRKGFI